MTSADEIGLAQLDPDGLAHAQGRVRRMIYGSRALLRIVHRDPEHVAERLTLHTIDRLADPTQEWAESTRSRQPDIPVARIGEEQRKQTAQIARIDGAVSGTPFFLVLIPGYVNYLRLEMRMTLRIAALHDRDPRHPQTAAEMLALRGVHPSAEAAAAALATVRDTPMPDKPTARRSLRTWVHSVYLLLVFGGFMSPSAAKPLQRSALDRLKSVLSLLLAVGIWAMTWVLPFTFMILMAWGCETHARQLGRRALLFYGGDAATVDAAIAAADQRQDRGHDKRTIIRTVALFLSVMIPIGFVGVAVHYHKTVGFNGVVALGALVAASLVTATIVVSSRR